MVDPIEKKIRGANLNSPANVLSGGGATQEQIESVKDLITDSKKIAQYHTGTVVGLIHQRRVAALEAVLAEREELLKDKARLDSNQITISRRQYIRVDLRACIDHKMKGEG